ncbi:hypothetical protein BYT27DRAFT_7177806 [Phlegmacium glaucopus]|nr:hypothetical protein BYT27DRAFT_7177806 [Phlegmacium glaucopus]
MICCADAMDKTTVDNHPSLYLIDGNIVLVAPRSAGGFVAFRVHRSILAKVSSVFESMFSLPMGEHVEEYDGVPAVYMSDCAEQLENLLMMMYHEVFLPFKPLDPRTPNSVKPILLLANKYAMDRIRERIVDHIEQDWPLTLQLWDKLEFQIDWARQLSRSDADIYQLYLDDHLPEPVSAIRLARECDIPSILPAAFYHLSRLSISHAGNGLRDADDGRRTAEWDLLSAQDLLCLIRGQRRLAWVAQEMPTQLPGRQCDCAALDCLKVFKEVQDACEGSSDVLQVIRSYMERGSYGPGSKICLTCCYLIRYNLAQFRQEIWTSLPSFFCL